MADFFARLKQRKIVQWAIAYVAFAFALLQGLDVFAQVFAWPPGWMRGISVALVVGFFVVLALAWYHGERGAQRLSGGELLILALLLAIGGGLLWRFARPAASAASSAKTALAQHATGTPSATSGSHGHATKVAAATSVVGVAETLSASPVPTAAIPAKSVAVLPFENLSADKNNAYFADGMQDLILTKLADVGDLKVISRTSTEKYKSHPGDLKTIGRQLNVATILEGSVQKAGKQVLINVQLIDAKTDSHIWAQSYTRTLDNIFGVEGEVADKVAKALNAKLTSTEQHQIAQLPTTNPEAYTLYLKGVHEINEYFMGDVDANHVKRAAAYLQQSVNKDPHFALAYALLARAQGDLQFNDIENSPALARNELANARKAVALQPRLAEAHDDLAVAYGANGMFDKVIPELETSLRLAPTDERTRFHLAMNYKDRGDWDKAKIIMAPLIQMNPTSGLAYERVAEMDMDLGRYEEAQATLEQGLAVAPKSGELVLDQAYLFLYLGEPDKALQWSAKLPTSLSSQRRSLAYSAYMLQRQYAQALAAAESLPDNGNGFDRANKQLMMADAAWHAGDRAQAQTALNQARNAIQGYLKPLHPKSASSLAYETSAYDVIAAIEMLSGHRQAAMDAIHKSMAVAKSLPFFRRQDKSTGSNSRQRYLRTLGMLGPLSRTSRSCCSHRAPDKPLLPHSCGSIPPGIQSATTRASRRY